MKNSHSVWQRLVVAARQSPIAGEAAAPYGFSTRVAALAMAAVERPSLRSSLNHFSWRALGFSLMLMIVSIVANYSSVTTVAENEQDAVFDPVEEILTLS
jgi:hypothetical protein